MKSVCICVRNISKIPYLNFWKLSGKFLETYLNDFPYLQPYLSEAIQVIGWERKHEMHLKNQVTFENVQAQMVLGEIIFTERVYLSRSLRTNWAEVKSDDTLSLQRGSHSTVLQRERRVPMYL